jgi:di/tricarboxylate transporter
MLPVTLNLARERDIPPSKLLLPLSFAASLGTTITIIGAPAFLIASSILQQAGRPALGIFSITPIGLALSVIGTLFMLLVGRFLLPARNGGDDSADRFRLDDYFTEVTILPDSPFLEKTIEEVRADDRYQLQIVGMLHDGRQIHGRINRQRLSTGDVLMVRTSPEEIVAIRQEAGLELHPVKQYGDAVASPPADIEDITDQLVQAVVAPTSDLINRTLGEIDFRRRYGALVVGLWRKRGWMRQQLSKIKLRAGDVLVLQGDSEALSRVEQDASFLMLMPFQGEPRPRRKAVLAGAIMLTTIIVTALNLLSLEIAALTGAVAMVISGCITTRQAYREIDGRIYLFIAGALPLGVGMEKTGASQLIAKGIQGTVAGWNQILILFVLFAIVAVLTQFMSDAGTTAIFAPVALALAQTLGHAPEPYVITVAMAAVTAFLTPIGHHGNLLVYGPGNYQFSDFVKVGTPLTVLAGVTVAILAPLIWRG